MKKFSTILVSFVLALLACATQSYAQAGKFGATPEDSVQCIQYLSFYRDYYKNGNYREALPSWRGAMAICPRIASEALYQHGQSILKFLINQTSDPTRREELIDSLIMMYDIRLDNFPKSKTRLSAYTYKAYDIAAFRKDDKQNVYQALSDVVAYGGDKTDPAILVLNMQYATDLFKEGQLEAQTVLDLYEKIGELFAKKAAQKEDEALKEAQSNFETIFAISGVADCDNLIRLFEPRFDASASDVAFVKRVVQLLSNAGCEQSDLFLKSVNALYALEPSANSAYYLYRLYASREDNENAIAYLQKAIEDTTVDNATRADYTVQLGTFYFKVMNNKPSAAEAARKAMELDDSVKGKACMLLGYIWAMAKSTGETEIDTRANFWVSVDYFSRAKAADATLAEECDKLISQYRQYFPTVEEAFMHDLSDGNSYSVSCPGLSATTTVRTRK